ncbi:methyl-accepting chemotaxis protein [Terasakiella sp. A23]|uniref:methyl-accepting chemotaxis protein n=1 Tax=Terasakiella sp. FCG-A23 TaxID=3080561 RepID=UPI0029553D78|nr:methyl-accepting chemotaxis protein [Terasakiella sp. A23]MDV7339342.1 methyl-accepting chemotaxis protein [Terasakiella sp. A23]
MTISLRIMLIVGALSAFLFLEAAWQAFGIYKEWNEIEEIAYNEEVSRDLILAARFAAVERGMTQGVIGSRGKKADSLKSGILANRQKLDEIMARVFNDGAVQREDMVKHVKALRETYSNLKVLREDVDRVFSGQDVSSRLTSDWFTVASTNIAELFLVRTELEILANLNPVLSINMSARQTLASLAEILGRERGRMNGYIAANVPLFPNEVVPLRIISGGIQTRLDDLKKQTNMVTDELGRAMTKALDNYERNVKLVRDREIKNGQSGRDYEISAPDWFALTTAGIAEFNKVADRISEDIQNELTEEIHAKRNDMVLIGILTLVIFAIVIASIYVTLSHIKKPINLLVKSMGGLAKGDLQTEIPQYPVSSEMGRMSDALERFKAEALENERYREEQEEFKRKTEEAQRKVLLNVADDFETAVGQVATSISASAQELAASSESVMSMAARSAESGGSVQDMAQKTMEEIQVVAEAAVEMDSATREIMDQVMAAASQTSEASNVANDAAGRVQSLVDASNEISGVLKLISDIAEQTNLLALNATVEAARAGDAGKGFAVVANEVKNLANQTHKATDQIGRQINSMVSEIDQTTKGVQVIASAVTNVSHTVQGISTASEQLSATAREISDQMGGANERLTTSSKAIIEMVDLSLSTQTAVSQVNNAAKELSVSGVNLQDQSVKFLRNVRK